MFFFQSKLLIYIIGFFHHHLESISRCLVDYSLLTYSLFEASEDFLLYGRNTQAPMARAVTIPNAIDIRIARSYVRTGGGGGGADCSTGGRGGGAYSCMGSRVISWISDTIVWVANIFTNVLCIV